MGTKARRWAGWIGGLAALLILPADGAFSAEADNAAPAKQAAQPARPVHRTCTDMDGQPFRWDWANVPFVSNCRVDHAPATSPQPRQTPK